MTGFFIMFGLLSFMIGLYLFSYSLNRKTNPPEGVELPDKCSTCHSGSCSIRDTDESKDCLNEATQ
ncbi:MAG: hypothetical protein JXR62_06885 [Bacilli bacterium]|nr:hypothetical protein [Bacilli bacterium]